MKKLICSFIFLFSTNVFAGNAGGGGTNGFVADDLEAVYFVKEDDKYTYFHLAKKNGNGDIVEKKHRLAHDLATPQVVNYKDALLQSKAEKSWTIVK